MKFSVFLHQSKGYHVIFSVREMYPMATVHIKNLPPLNARQSNAHYATYLREIPIPIISSLIISVQILLLLLLLTFLFCHDQSLSIVLVIRV